MPAVVQLLKSGCSRAASARPKVNRTFPVPVSSKQDCAHLCAEPLGPIAASSNSAAKPSPGCVRAQLDKILASNAFAGAERPGRFLRFVVEQALAGHQLKEMLLGVEVFGRNPSYDPRLDGVVRVVSGVKLRSRLKEYYETEGAGDPVRLDLPKGGYLPSFEALPSQPAETVAAPYRNSGSQREARRWRTNPEMRAGDATSGPPLSPYKFTGAGMIYSDRREYDRAVEQFRKAIELDPSFYHAYDELRGVETVRGRPAAVDAVMQQAMRALPRNRAGKPRRAG